MFLVSLSTTLGYTAPWLNCWDISTHLDEAGEIFFLHRNSLRSTKLSMVADNISYTTSPELKLVFWNVGELNIPVK